MKEFRKSVNICQRYGQLQSGTFFETQCILTICADIVFMLAKLSTPLTVHTPLKTSARVFNLLKFALNQWRF